RETHMPTTLWPTLLGVLLLSWLAGWFVTWLADTIPARRSLLATWHWPLYRLGLGDLSLGRVTPSKELADGTIPPLRRYLLVWLAAIGLGWLAYVQLGWTAKALLV